MKEHIQKKANAYYKFHIGKTETQVNDKGKAMLKAFENDIKNAYTNGAIEGLRLAVKILSEAVVDNVHPEIVKLKEQGALLPDWEC